MERLFSHAGITTEICARLHSDDLKPLVEAVRLERCKVALLNLYEYIFTLNKHGYPRAYIEWPLKCYNCNDPMRHELYDRRCNYCNHPFCKKCYRWECVPRYHNYKCDYCVENSHGCFACGKKQPDYQMLLWCKDCNIYACKDCTLVRCTGCGGKSICNCPITGRWIITKNNPSREYWCGDCLKV